MSEYIYKFTFEDGSEAFAHYGVKGMKWNKHLKALDPEYLASLGLGGAQAISNAVETGAQAAQAGISDTMQGVQETADDIAKKAEQQKERLRTRFLGPRKFDPSSGKPVDNEKNIEYAKEHSDTIRIKKTEQTPDQDMMNVNKNFKYGMDDYRRGRSQFINSIVNCATCSMVYDLRRRGYDVDANMTTNAMYTMSDVPGFYKGAKKVSVPGSDLNQLDRSLMRQPDGARGMVTGVTIHGGGHAIAWEKENGKIVYRDCQSNTRYNSPKELSKLYSSEQSERADHRISYYRLDNCEVNLRGMHQGGIISKTGPEYTYGQQKKDIARHAAGQVYQQLRLEKKITDTINKNPLYRLLINKGRKAKVEYDPWEVLKESVRDAKRAYDYYDELDKREKLGKRYKP